MDTGILTSKGLRDLAPHVRRAEGPRLPVALGLGLGAAASLTLWAGLIAGVRALLF